MNACTTGKKAAKTALAGGSLSLRQTGYRRGNWLPCLEPGPCSFDSAVDADGRFGGGQSSSRALPLPFPLPPPGRPNLLFFGKRSGFIRPASERLPRQPTSSFIVSEKVRPAESYQVSPSSLLNVLRSESPPSLKRCSRTPRPRAISGTCSSGKITILRFSPIEAASSPSTLASARAASGALTLSTCLPLRVLARHSSSATTKPRPCALPTRNLRPPR